MRTSFLCSSVFKNAALAAFFANVSAQEFDEEKLSLGDTLQDITSHNLRALHMFRVPIAPHRNRYLGVLQEIELIVPIPVINLHHFIANMN